MPLYARRADDHFPDRARSPRPDYYVVLSGAFEVGGFHRIGSGPSEGRWSWGAGIGTGNANFTAGGYASHPDMCQTMIGLAFRRMLARADLRERRDAKPGPPRRATPDAIAEPSTPTPPYDRDIGPMVRNKRCITLRSGELIVGLLSRSTHGPETWNWILSGVARPDDNERAWHGQADTEDEAFDALAGCWSRWLDWAGLEPVAPLQRGMRRG